MCGCTDENKEDIRMFKSYSMELGGRTLTLEFGKYAEQAPARASSAMATPAC